MKILYLSITVSNGLCGKEQGPAGIHTDPLNTGLDDCSQHLDVDSDIDS